MQHLVIAAFTLLCLTSVQAQERNQQKQIVSQAPRLQPSSYEIQRPIVNIPGVFKYHTGFMAGFGLGIASEGCHSDGCERLVGVGIDLHAGGFLNPALALMLDISGVVGESEAMGVTTTEIVTIYNIALQRWLMPRMWLKLGLGYGDFEFSSNEDTVAKEKVSKMGFALLAGVGFEVFQSKSFALDLSGRFGYLRINDEIDFQGERMSVNGFTTFGLHMGARWK